MQCELVGFVSRGLITLTEGKNKESAEENNSKLAIQKDIRSTSNKSKLLDLQALVYKCIAGCHLVALGHGMLTED